MNPATSPFKGAWRSRYFVSHDISPFERSSAGRRGLYNRLGFEVEEDEGVYDLMRCKASREL